MRIEHKFFDGAGVKLHAATCGDGQPVILLHGFPEFWGSWRKQMVALDEAWFQAIALDQRGYNLSDRPVERSAYALSNLVEDLASVIRQLGVKPHLVAHDWGGIVAWAFAGRYPHLVDKLVIINAPHSGIYRYKAMMPPQLLKSWYIGFFALPFHVAENAISAGDFASLRRVFSDGPKQRDTFSPAEIQEYVDVMKQPGALTAALNWYRENLLTPGAMQLAETAHVTAPTLVLWGEKDQALDVSLLEGLEKFAPNLTVKRFPQAGHWLQNELPDEVNQALISFLKG